MDFRLFVICLDDSIVVFWDVRFLKYKLYEFKGYINWVKNIEYDRNIGFFLFSVLMVIFLFGILIGKEKDVVCVNLF